ncbi:MAG: hypothetical protein OEV85_07655 [Candidatus Thorarchaeota archaeon]|nr:hypothetical protein [Candidatus Thorarchaeota archaeon]
MRKLNVIFPDLGLFPAFVITLVLSIVLQLSGAWITMFLVGVLSSMFVRRHRTAFGVGFFGVFIGWLFIFVYLILTAQALPIADFFIGLLGLGGLGWLVIAISSIIGGLLGGFGGLLGRSIVDLVDELLPNEAGKETKDNNR